MIFFFFFCSHRHEFVLIKYTTENQNMLQALTPFYSK